MVETHCLKIIKMELEEIFKYLEEHKKYVGLSEWKILILEEIQQLDSNHAAVSVDIYKKTIKIILTKLFYETDKKEQEETLFHELVHAKMLIYREKCQEHLAVLEEHLVNDLVRGFMKYKNERKNIKKTK